MFSTLRAVLIGVGPRQRALIGEQFMRCGGELLDLRDKSKVFPLFKSSATSPDSSATAISASLTHVFVEERGIALNTLLRELHCDSLPASIQVVHTSWLTDSLKQNSLMEEGPYLINLGVALKRTALEGMMNGPKRLKANEGVGISAAAAAGFSSSSVAQGVVDTWTVSANESYMYKLSGANPTGHKLIGFDMDSTVIKTRSGKAFADNANDWQYFSAKVPQVIQQYIDAGYHAVLISNQGGLSVKKSDSKAKREELQRKVDAVLSGLERPVDFICSFEDDMQRKPRPGMWAIILGLRGMRVEACESLYVGDAAGRPAVGKERKKDFSASDLLFAHNVGCAFHTPESFFLGSTRDVDNKFDMDAHKKLADMHIGPMQEGLLDVLSPRGREVVLLVGAAASGKSSIARLMLGHERVNQDSLRTLAACLARAGELLAEGKRDRSSVVVDNTNLSREIRKSWVALARSHDVDIRCIRVQTSKETTMLLRTFRSLSPATPTEDQRHIPNVVIHSHFKSLEEPTTAEGFLRVDVIPFSFRPDETSPAVAAIQRMFL